MWIFVGALILARPVQATRDSPHSHSCGVLLIYYFQEVGKSSPTTPGFPDPQILPPTESDAWARQLLKHRTFPHMYWISQVCPYLPQRSKSYLIVSYISRNCLRQDLWPSVSYVFRRPLSFYKWSAARYFTDFSEEGERSGNISGKSG